MRWLDHREPVPAPLRGAIIALGNFDGFHKGHQAVATEAIRWAREEERPVIVATFDPHPVQFFRPDTPPFRLTSLEQRHELYLAFGATAMHTSGPRCRPGILAAQGAWRQAGARIAHGFRRGR